MPSTRNTIQKPICIIPQKTARAVPKNCSQNEAKRSSVKVRSLIARFSLGWIRVCRYSGLGDRKSTRLNSSHGYISYAVFCLKKKKETILHISSTSLFAPIETCTTLELLV